MPKTATFSLRGLIETTLMTAIPIAAVWGILFGGVALYQYSKCEYVCSGNGDEPAWRLLAGCWCRDSTGLYNPDDSRGSK